MQNAKLFVTASGTIPLKLPKALVLSQFSTIASLPHVVPLDVIVDGVPAGVCQQRECMDTCMLSGVCPARIVKQDDVTIEELFDGGWRG